MSGSFLADRKVGLFFNCFLSRPPVARDDLSAPQPGEYRYNGLFGLRPDQGFLEPPLGIN